MKRIITFNVVMIKVPSDQNEVVLYPRTDGFKFVTIEFETDNVDPFLVHG